MRSTILFRWSSLLAAAALATTAGAQVAGEPGSLPEAWQHSPAPHAQPAAAAAVPPSKPDAAATAPTPARAAYATSPVLDTPAEPAHIALTGGKLSIQAKNSSLADILHQLAKDTGMSIDGLSKDQRIFGIYGPDDPREVLSELLDGAGFNVLMLGSTDSGAPRELQLSIRNNGPIAAGQPSTVAQQQQDDDQDDTPSPTNYPPAGEIVPRPPIAPPNQASPNGGVKTPQQLLQELEQMRRQQQQQQQQQPQPQ